MLNAPSYTPVELAARLFNYCLDAVHLLDGRLEDDQAEAEELKGSLVVEKMQNGEIVVQLAQSQQHVTEAGFQNINL
jgi:hypothetical protein